MWRYQVVTKNDSPMLQRGSKAAVMILRVYAAWDNILTPSEMYNAAIYTAAMTHIY